VIHYRFLPLLGGILVSSPPRDDSGHVSLVDPTLQGDIVFAWSVSPAGFVSLVTLTTWTTACRPAGRYSRR